MRRFKWVFMHRKTNSIVSFKYMMFLAVHEWIDCELLIGTVTKVVVGTVFIVSEPLQQFVA